MGNASDPEVGGDSDVDLESGEASDEHRVRSTTDQAIGNTGGNGRTGGEPVEMDDYEEDDEMLNPDESDL